MISWKPIQDLMIECYAGIEMEYQSNQLEGISTGFPELDRMIGGLNWGELIIIGGQANMGKTALALDFARHAALRAKDKSSVAILSLDDPELLIAKRLLAAESRVELHRVLSGKLLSEKRWGRLAKAAGLLADSTILIDHTPDISLQELWERCLHLKDNHPSLDLVIIDHLQGMKDWHEAICNKRKLYELMKGLHNMAEDMDVALIVVTELSRTLHERTDKRPRLTDFPEYGSIEMLGFDNMEADVVPFEGFPMKEFASKVLLLYREEVFRPANENHGKAELNVAQNAGGETGIIALRFHPEFASFAGTLTGGGQCE